MSAMTNATGASSLTEELLMEIIKRLPVKYILRCRSVQKSWYHLLRSPYFISIHSRHHNTLNKYLLFHQRHEDYFSLRFDNKQCNEYCELRCEEEYFYSSGAIVYETCNGLICFSATRMRDACLWNPALRVFDVLPDPPIPDDSLTHPITLGLDFVYLAKTDDYKVVKYEKFLGVQGPQFYVYVYSLITDSWKTVVQGKFGSFACNKLSNSVVVNGGAYWVGSKYEVRDGGKVIVCLDLENHVIREIVLPSPYSKENAKSVVLVEKSVFGEILSLFYYDRSTFVLHIWVLENAGEVWMKKTSLNFERSWRPMAFRNNGEMLLRGGGKKFLSYDFKEAKDIVDDDSLDTFYISGEIYPFSHQGINCFQETLVLLDVDRQNK